MEIIDNIYKIYSENWEHNVKVAQKDMHYMFKVVPTKVYEFGDDKLLYINAADYYKFGEKYFDAELCNKPEFISMFEKVCKVVIDKNFELLAGAGNFMHDFIADSYGSGVEGLFWVYHHMCKYADIKKIVVDNLDGLLHYSSMQQYCRLYQDNGEFDVLFLMNNYPLFTTSIMELDDLYIIHDDKIANIRKCTDRELRPSHNLENLIRAGEFDNILE